ncbi:NADH-quinone oxidoreductase subunit C [Desulfovibrio intestinalis]|uniref:NADH-quinone oxidoreductase subunit C n=1 Tax=Desulfovibrio intestinalis TaxID=58621 RepID=A0A7W8FFD8_9BACT|nr:NADH-quinone oxidoreductase subunit C [Desulfovibrio intestinalis]MBB5142700.1 NADH-quinone oxidoreductase subunit C [Desulfovibrio intestinalis]
MTQQNAPNEALAAKLAALSGAEVRQTDYAAKGYDLDVSLTPETLVPAVTIMDEAGYFLETITGVDWLGEQAALRKAAEAAEAAEAKARADAQAKLAEETKPETTGSESAAATSSAAPNTAPGTGADVGTVAGAGAATNSGSGTATKTGATPAQDTAAQVPPPEAAPLPEDEIEVVYDFNRFESRHRVVLRVRTPRSQPQVPTILNIYPIAHWHEREAHDFFGIVFTGHSYLVPLLLPEDADFHPLLKDYGA